MERDIVGITECRAMRVPLAQPGSATFCWGEVWLASRGPLIICWGIYIVRDDGLLSFIVSSLVPCLTTILHIPFAKIESFFYLGLQSIFFKLQMFSTILQFSHLSYLLLLFLFHVLTPMNKLIFGRLDH